MGVVVITGGSAGVGRATVEVFARAGWNTGIIARGQERLDAAVAEVRGMGREACAVSADVADAGAVEHAAETIEQQLGPIDVWVNNAMATVFGPVMAISPEEFRRGTEVTYLGQVHGTIAALRRMRERNRGVIVNIGSALAYRSVPLQSVYCASKYATRGFFDALRSEIIHDRINVHLTMVHLAAMNTPQFDWARNKMDRRPQPVPPIFEPEVAARAVLFAATHKRRDIWVGFPTVKAIIASALVPDLLDHYLAKAGYTGQLTNAPKLPDAPDNLVSPATGNWGAHGRFDSRSRSSSWEMWTSRHRDAVFGVGLALAGFGIVEAAARLSERNKTRLR